MFTLEGAEASEVSISNPAGSLRQACDRCHTRKERCIRDDQSQDSAQATCVRCFKAGSTCSYTVAKRTGRPLGSKNTPRLIVDEPMVGRFAKLPHSICFTLQGIENIIAHHFRVTSLLWEALQGVRTSLPGMTDHKNFPDGNRRLALIGGFAIGLAFAENVNAGEEDAESFESIVRKFGSDSCLRSVGEKVGLEKIFVPKNSHGKVIEAEVPIDATVRALLGAVYLDVDMNGVRRTLANLNQILAELKKGEPEGYSGIGWLDVVLRQGNEEEGSSSGGDEANSDVGQRDVEMQG